MEKLRITVFLLLIGASCYSQEKKSKKTDNCPNLMNQISYFWKLDSMGTNGYRLQMYHGLMACKFPDLTLEKMKEKLGKPNFERKQSDYVIYCYYFYLGTAIPKSAGLTREIGSVGFVFYNNKRYLDEVIRIDEEPPL